MDRSEHPGKEMIMKAKEEVKKEENNLQEENLPDLPVAVEQADETKGGPTKATLKLFLCPADPR